MVTSTDTCTILTSLNSDVRVGDNDIVYGVRVVSRAVSVVTSADTSSKLTTYSILNSSAVDVNLNAVLCCIA